MLFQVTVVFPSLYPVGGQILHSLQHKRAYIQNQAKVYNDYQKKKNTASSTVINIACITTFGRSTDQSTSSEVQLSRLFCQLWSLPLKETLTFVNTGDILQSGKVQESLWWALIHRNQKPWIPFSSRQILCLFLTFFHNLHTSIMFQSTYLNNNTMFPSMFNVISQIFQFPGTLYYFLVMWIVNYTKSENRHCREIFKSRRLLWQCNDQLISHGTSRGPYFLSRLYPLTILSVCLYKTDDLVCHTHLSFNMTKGD